MGGAEVAEKKRTEAEERAKEMTKALYPIKQPERRLIPRRLTLRKRRKTCSRKP
jgi:hypothetical protein